MSIELSLASEIIPRINKVENTVLKSIPKQKLESDIFEKSVKTVKEEIPVYKGSSVSMHHDVNASNPSIRSYLENPNPEREDNYLKKYIEEIDKEFENLPPLENNYTVWRGRMENPIIKRFNKDFEIVDNAKVGDIIVPDSAYSYTAFHRSLAENWSGSYNFFDNPNRSILYEIHLPKGAKVSRNLEHGGEVLMPRGAKYRVISKSTDKYGCTHVKLDYIIPDK